MGMSAAGAGAAPFALGAPLLRSIMFTPSRSKTAHALGERPIEAQLKTTHGALWFAGIRGRISRVERAGVHATSRDLQKNICGATARTEQMLVAFHTDRSQRVRTACMLLIVRRCVAGRPASAI
jgi:hypothetical protein